MTERVLDEIGIESWNGPFEAELRSRARNSLENGLVLYFPKLAFCLDAKERDFLSPAIASGTGKNISLDPDTGALKGSSASGESERRLARMIDRFGQSAQVLVETLIGYRGMERARTSFRPVEIEGRSYSPRKDDRLLHVDAFPSRPMRGRRILRVFSNVAADRTRNWNVGEPFEDFARKFLPRVRASWPGQAALFAALGVTRGKRSRYDETMLALHDRVKFDAGYQANAPKTPLGFPPGSSWMVFTDQVLHAALGGAFALEQTFHFDVDVMGEPARAPLRVLERLTEKTLV
ncbi:MAG: Kdo hydroxylase family protein [Alphaproteobacteria bacterium]|nr:Kdo hydroxylase family protein [Alphaproteobacteria bacterium]